MDNNKKTEFVFGQEVLSYSYSIDYYYCVLKKFKFVFKRPDTGMCIIERNGRYLEDREENILTIDKKGFSVFELKLLSELYSKTKEEDNKILQLEDEIKIIQNEIDTLNYEKERATLNQQELYNETRNNGIKNLEKAIRRKNNKIKNRNEKILEIKRNILKINSINPLHYQIKD